MLPSGSPSKCLFELSISVAILSMAIICADHADVMLYWTVATFQTASSNGVVGRDSRNSFSSANQDARMPSCFWKSLWLKASSFSQMV